MTPLTTAAILLSLPWAPGSAWEVDEAGLAILEACDWGWGPAEAPAGEACLFETAILWHLESRLSIYPPARGTGCGVGQIIPGRLWNARIREVWTPTCDELRVPRVGLRWTVRLLRMKARFGSFHARARAFNGSALRDSYARRAVELLDRVRAAVEGRET